MDNKKYLQEFLRETETSSSSSTAPKKLYSPIPLATLTELSESRSILSDRNLSFAKTGDGDGKWKKCICERPNSTIICTACEMFSFGRIRQNCEFHKNIVFLMDFSYCPNCHAGKYMLYEIDGDFDTMIKQNAQKLSLEIQTTNKRYST